MESPILSWAQDVLPTHKLTARVATYRATLSQRYRLKCSLDASEYLGLKEKLHLEAGGMRVKKQFCVFKLDGNQHELLQLHAHECA